MGRTLTIGEVAARTGLAASALRYYERERLIPRAARAGGKRVWSEDVLDRIAQLPSSQRTAMTLAYYQDLRQHEIAAHLGCSQMQVSRLLKRGRAALAEHLTR